MYNIYLFIMFDIYDRSQRNQIRLKLSSMGSPSIRHFSGRGFLAAPPGSLNSLCSSHVISGRVVAEVATYASKRWRTVRLYHRSFESRWLSDWCTLVLMAQHRVIWILSRTRLSSG